MGTDNLGYTRASSSPKYTPLEKMNFISTSTCLSAKLIRQKSFVAKRQPSVQLLRSGSVKNSTYP